jgi:N-acyl-phosphatidylethanolamine-hydrolysing phospholipase D
VATLLLAAIVGAAALDHLPLRAEGPPPAGPSQHRLGHRFRNIDPRSTYTLAARAERLFRRTLAGWPPRGPALRIVQNDGAELRANGAEPTVTWVGHATFLVQLGGLNILTDPHWGETIGPVRMMGFRRLVPPGIPFEDLPRIDAVVISHDHSDHLDPSTVKRLARRDAPRFIVPLGIKQWLGDLGIANVVELDWWESTRLGPLTLTSVPAQHSSGRTLTDQNLRLWCSWVIEGAGRRLFFAGDTGYHSGFKEIRHAFGPFDVALLPIGGYSAFEGHHPTHLNPEEAVQAFEDLGAARLVPMHWGTFETNHEPSREPPDRLVREALKRGLEPRVRVLSPGETLHW